ncbi:MAG: hypothetical protein H0X17_14365 [Deltaproteobacteria bacterium]|nr:hypothetical protein [Deltaproteobacteria bacterium]
MLSRNLPLLGALAPIAPVLGCQGTTPAITPAPTPIEARDAKGVVTARVMPGHPCRATVDDVELLVASAPLVAQVGGDRWSGESGTNGLTLKKNDAPVARLHARQLFDAQGIPLLRVLPGGEIADAASAIVRHAKASPNAVTVGDFTVSGTSDVVLAAMLTARETSPEVRALVACHLLFAE